MLDIGEPLKPDWAQERWSQYIISERNSPNNIHRTKKLSVDTVGVNDSLHAEYEKIISSEDWTHNTPSFKLITDRWAKVMQDYIKLTASKDETAVDLRHKALREAKLKQLRDKVESTFFKKTKPSETEKPKTYTAEEIDALLSEI